MTSFNSKATPSELRQTKINELDRIIEVLKVTGQDDKASEIEEIKPVIDEIIKDLYDLVDDNPQKTFARLFGSSISRKDKTEE